MPQNGQHEHADYTAVNAQSKYWCFTLNNYTEEEENLLQGLITSGKCEYLVYGREVGESGTKHLQGYLEFKSKLRRAGVVKLPGLGGAHVAKRYTESSAEACRTYCTKDGDFHESGQISTPQQGKRTDLDLLVEDIKEGLGERELMKKHMKAFIMYPTGIKRVYELMSEISVEVHTGPFPWKYPDTIRSLVLCGKSGIGKSEFAKFLMPDALWTSDWQGLRLFDPTRHKGIIFDDVNFSKFTREQQIHILDYDNPRDIRVLYGTVRIPAGTRKIFVANDRLDAGFFEDPAINRRLLYADCHDISEGYVPAVDQ